MRVGVKQCLAVLFFSLAALSFSAAGADDTCPSPEVVLKRAKVSRVEYIKVLGEVQAFAPKFISEKEAYPYLLILDELKEIGKKLEVEGLGGSPLDDLAQLLTSNCMKWVRVDLDSPEVLRAFFKWADDNIRFATAQEQIFHLKPVSDKSQLLRWHEAAEKTIALATELKATAAVKQALGELQALTVKKLLAMKKDLTNDEITKILAHTKGGVAMGEALAFLQEQALVAKDPASLRLVLIWAVAIGKRVKESANELPHHVKSGPGRILVDTVTKLLGKEETPDAALVPSILENLEPSQLTELGAFLVAFYTDKPVPERLIEFDWMLVTQILEKYKDMDAADKIPALAKLQQRLTQLRVLARGHYEGTYEITIDRDRKAVLTLANIGAANFILGLRIVSTERDFGGFGTDFSFYHVAFHHKKDLYQSHHFAVDSPDYIPPHRRNWWIEFVVVPTKGKPTISGRYTTGRGFHTFEGAQVEQYETYAKVPSGEKPEEVTALYEGTLEDGRKVALNLTQVGQRVAGTFTTGNGASIVDLTFGYFNAPRSVVYVTTGDNWTGELDGGRWAQVRGQLEDGGKKFTGQYIIGGQGDAGKLSLTRTQ